MDTKHNPAFLSMSRKRSRFTTGFRSSKRRKVSGSAKSIAKQALAKVRGLERKQEVKVYDINLTTIANVSTAGDSRSIAAITTGSLINNRDGNQISPFFMKMRLQWHDTVITNTNVLYRTIIYRDLRQVGGEVPAVLDVLTVGNPLSMIVQSNRKRWKILFDRTWTRSKDSLTSNSFVAVIGLKLSLPMRWSGAASGAHNMNGLYMINLTNLAADTPSMTFTHRLFFNDN